MATGRLHTNGLLIVRALSTRSRGAASPKGEARRAAVPNQHGITGPVVAASLRAPLPGQLDGPEHLRVVGEAARVRAGRRSGGGRPVDAGPLATAGVPDLAAGVEFGFGVRHRIHR